MALDWEKIRQEARQRKTGSNTGSSAGSTNGEQSERKTLDWESIRKQATEKKAANKKSAAATQAVSALGELEKLYSDYATQYKSRYTDGEGFYDSYRTDTQDWQNKTNTFADQWNQQSLALRTLLTDAGDALDSQALNDVKTWLGEVDRNVGKMQESAAQDVKFYSQWENADAFAAWQKEDAKKTLDLKTANAELDAARQELETLTAEANAFLAAESNWADFQHGGGKRVVTYEEGMTPEEYNAAVVAYGNEQKQLVESYRAKYGTPEAMREQIQALQTQVEDQAAYLKDAKRIQGNAALTLVADPTSELYDPEFEKYSAPVSTDDSFYNEVMLGTNDLETLTAEANEFLAAERNWADFQQGGGKRAVVYEEGMTPEEYNAAVAAYGNEQKQLVESYRAKYGSLEQLQAKVKERQRQETERIELAEIYSEGYELMTEQERKLFNYYYSKHGKEAAKMYLTSIEDTLHARVGKRVQEGLPNTGLYADVISAMANLDRWGSDMGSAINALAGNHQYKAPSSLQYANMGIRENRKDRVWYNFADGEWEDEIFGLSVGKLRHDLVGTAAYMIPSIAGGTLANTIAPGSGAIVGNTLMGMSAAGGAYQEKINAGYSATEAKTYGLLVGASEATLQYALGGIGSLAASGTSGLARVFKGLGKIDDVFSRFAKSGAGKLLLSAGSEAIEEGLQTVIEPYLWRAASGEEVSVDMQEALYSALLGFLTGGLFEGVSSAQTQLAQNTEYRQIGSKVLEMEGGVDALTSLALEMQEQSPELRKLAAAVNKKATQRNVGKLKTAVSKAAQKQTGKELTAKLQEKGFDTETADKIADALATVTTDPAGLTREQSAYLERFLPDSRVQEALSEDTAEAAPADELHSLAQEMAQEGTEALEPYKIESLEGKTFQKSTRQTVQMQKFAEISDGKATAELEDGTVIPAEDISFENTGEDVLFHFLHTEENMTAEGANAIWPLWQANKNSPSPVSAETFRQAAITLWRAGQKGDARILNAKDGSVAALSEQQRELIYEASRRAAQEKAASAQAKVDTVYAEAKKILQENGQTKGGHRAVTTKGISVKRMNRQQRAAYRLAEQIAPGIQGNIVVYDGGKKWGRYDSKTDTIYLNINAKWDHTTMLAFTLGHELAHRAKQGSPAQFKAFADFLITEYGKQGADIDAMVAEQIAAAEEDGIEMSEDEAFEEVVADACQKMLLDTDAGKRLAEFGAQNVGNHNYLQKIRKWLTELLDYLRQAFRDVEPDSLAAKEFARFDENVKQNLADMFVDMSLDAGEKLSTIKEAGLTEKITTEGGGVKYKLPKLEEVTPSKNQIEANIREIIKMKPVCNIDANKLSDTGNDIKAIYREFFVSWGENIHSELFGDIATKKSSIGSEFTHGNTAAKIASIEAIPSVISEGKIIDWFEKHKGLFRIVVAAPIKIGNTAYYMGVMLQRDNQNQRLYIHDVILEKEASNSTREHLSTTGPRENENLFMTSILERIRQVKEKSQTDYDSKNKMPVSRDVSDRAMLADMFEQMVTNSKEHKALENYRKQMDEMLEIEEHLERVTAEIRRLSFAEGPRDTETLKKLKLQQKQAINRLNNYDNILLRLEKSGVLKAMIERNSKKVTQERIARAKEYYRERNERRESEIRQYYRESRRQAIERHDKAEIRKRIRKDVERLNSLLNKGNKNKNVKQEMQAFADAALKTAYGTFLNNYNEYDMVRNGITSTMFREHRAIFDRCRELLGELDKLQDEKNPEPGADNLHDKWDPEAELRREDREEALKKELAKNMAILRDANIFRVENELMEDANSEQLMDELLGAYKALKDSELEYVKKTYSDAVYGQIEKVKQFLGGKAVKDMTAIELQELQKMYRLVLHTITTANDLFVQEKKTNVRNMGEKIFGQLGDKGKAMNAAIWQAVKKFSYLNLKPETVLEMIGSDELTGMMQGLFRGEGIYAADVEHGRTYAEEQAKKFGKAKWDMKKAVPFAGTQITLGQAMSLYAYTLREQAQVHMEVTGFTSSDNVRIKVKKGKHGPKIEYIMNPAKYHKVTESMYKDVKGLLTKEQQGYVEAMMDYLSQVMGAKGNEVSMKLHGIELFLEKHYFPIQTANEYLETLVGAAKGEVKLKNTGFTQPVVEDAGNPIVLDDFDRVWANHVNKMSLYHGLALPMEDFDRVYNYHKTEEKEIKDWRGEVIGTELVETEKTIHLAITNNCGSAVNDYIETFMQQLNGGVNNDPVENMFGAGLKKFKKAAVMMNLSVAAQQPTAFIRAMAYLDPSVTFDVKSWLGKEGKPDGRLVDEMYKYCPVAVMKKIGGFDPSLGRGSQNYLIKPNLKTKEGVQNLIDEVGGWMPEKLDQITWTYIWLCAKRQTKKNHPELRVGSEDFCKKAAELFTRIIHDTQVYDSVLTKTALMRNKSQLIKGATAFLNEPMTSLDMQIRAIIQAKRGKISGAECARRIACSSLSQIAASAVASFIYALRDDDEDKTYWEKYMGSFVGKSIENLIPLFSIPFVKDAIGIFKGWGAERTDMALVQDLADAIEKLSSDSATPWEKVEAVAGSIANLFGVPVKNLSRDVRAIYQTVENAFTVKGTDAGMRYAIIEGLPWPFGRDTGKKEQLQNAIVENDTAHLLRVLATYSNDASACTALRTAMKEMYLQGDVSAERVLEVLQTYAGDDTEGAQKYLEKWTFKRDYPDAGLGDAAIADWYEYAEPAGISLDIYTQYAEDVKLCTGEKDEEGETIQGSVKAQVLDVIDSLPISREQKDALYFANDYAESILDEAPWN